MTAEVSATRARCRPRGVIVPTGIGPRAAPRPPNQNAPAHGPIAPHHALASLGHAVQIAVPACYTTGGRYLSWTDKAPYVFIQYNNGISSSAAILSY